MHHPCPETEAGRAPAERQLLASVNRLSAERCSCGLQVIYHRVHFSMPERLQLAPHSAVSQHARVAASEHERTENEI